MNRGEVKGGGGAEEPAGAGCDAEERVPVVCRKLRTKVAFGSPHPGLRDWRHGESTTAVYWCLATMETAGPDDGYVHPHCCCAGRRCFVEPPDAEGDDGARIA